MSEWKECTIESLCKNICSGGTPNRSNDSFYQNGNIPWLNTKEVSFNRIYQTENFITELGLKSSSAKWIPANTVIVAMYGATAGRSAIAKIPLTTNQACCNLTIDEKKADYRFVYYTLFNQYSYLASMANGGAQQNLNAGMIREFKINLPDLETQTKIADVLSSLDDKIELNNQINRNLEEQVKGLYKKLLVADKNGKMGVLGDLVKVKYGKDHKKLSDGNVPVYGSGGIMRYADQYLYDKESVLIPRKGTLNNVIYVNEPFWSVDTMFYTEMKCENIAKYVYLFLSEKNLESLNAGSAVPSMTTDILNAMPILIPNAKSLASFEAFAAPIYTKIAENSKENKKLAMLRDALLPKLMSGEINVA